MKKRLLVATTALIMGAGAFAQEELKCSFEVQKNQTSYEVRDLRTSRVDFEVTLTSGERAERVFDLVQLNINPDENRRSEHDVIIFEEDMKVADVIKEHDLEYEATRLPDQLKVEVFEEAGQVVVKLKTSYWDYRFDFSRGFYGSLRGHLYSQASFEKEVYKVPVPIVGILFGKEDALMRRSVPIYANCRRSPAASVNQASRNQEPFKFEQRLQELKSSKVREQ